MAENPYEEFFDFASQNPSIDAILDLLHSRLENDLVFVNLPTGRRRIISTDLAFYEKANSYPVFELQRLFHFEILRVHDQDLGKLFVNADKDAIGRDTKLILRAAILALRFVAETNKRSSENTARRKQNHIEQILFNETLAPTTRFFYIDEARGLFPDGIATFSILDSRMQQTKFIIEICKRFKNFFGEQTILHRKYLSVIVFPITDLSNRHATISFIRNVFIDVSSNFQTDGLVAGVSSFHTDIEELKKAFKESIMAIRSSSLLKDPNNLFFWDEIGPERFLAMISETEGAKGFIESIIGKLATENKDLFETLCSLEENNWNLKQCARKSQFHYNSIKYRERRIEEILGIDLGEALPRFEISLAIKVKRMIDILNQKEGYY